jgi:hypothetical protein
MTTNEMTLAKAFRDAGIEQEKAEQLATTIFDAIRDNVATKSDLQHVEQTLKTDLQSFEQRIDLKFARLGLSGIGALVVGLSALFAAFQHWPPHITP